MKTKLNAIPNNYRELKQHETAKAGDLFMFKSGAGGVGTNDSGVYGVEFAVKVSEYADFEFFRRRHVGTRVKPAVLPEAKNKSNKSVRDAFDYFFELGIKRLPEARDKRLADILNGFNYPKLVPEKVLPETKVIDSMPLVRFIYRSNSNASYYTTREVKLIAADDKYLIGLDVFDNNQFKKFLRSKIFEFELLTFNLDAIE